MLILLVSYLAPIAQVGAVTQENRGLTINSAKVGDNSKEIKISADVVNNDPESKTFSVTIDPENSLTKEESVTLKDTAGNEIGTYEVSGTQIDFTILPKVQASIDLSLALASDDLKEITLINDGKATTISLATSESSETPTTSETATTTTSSTEEKKETAKRDSSEQSTEISDKADFDAETTDEKQNKATLKAIPADANWVTAVEFKLNGETIENGGTGSIELTGENNIELSYDLEVPEDSGNLAGETYSLPLPEVFKDMSNGEPIPLNDADGNKIGTYVIQDGKVLITFLEAADNLDGKAINVNISGSVDESVFENQDEVDVNIPFSDGDEYNSTIEVKRDPYEGTDKKEAGKPYVLDDNGEKVYTNKNPEYVDWTVRANDSMEEIKDAKVIDTLGDNLEIVPDSFKIEKIIRDRNNKETGRETITGITPEIKDPGFELNLGSISDAYDITYTTKITRPEGGGKLTVNNKASIVLDGDSNDYSDKVAVEFSNDIPTIQKDGAVSKDNGDIVNWTVKYNFGKKSIGTVNLTDKLTVGTVDSSSIKVVQVDTDIDGNIIPGTEKEVTVTPTTDAAGNVVIPNLDANGKAYLITFDSKVPVGTKETIINEMSDDQGNADDAKVDVNTIPTGGKVGEQKVDEKGNPYIEWTITMNTNKVNTPSINIKDVFNPKFLKFDVNDSSLYDLYQDGEKVDSDSYTVDDYTHEDGRKGFELNIKPAGAHEFKFVYRTYYTVAGMQEPNLANHAELIFDNGNGGTIGPGEGIDFNQNGPKAGIKKTGKYVYDSEGKQVIEWTVTFNNSKILLENGSKIVDEFTSGNYKYIDGSLSIKTDKNADFTDYNLDTSNPNPGFTINLTKTTKETLKVTYRTTADDAANADQTNKATLKWQGGDESDDETVGKRNPGISKKGSVVINTDGSKSVNWTIEFNKNKNAIYDFVLNDENTPNTVTIDKNLIKIVDESGNDVTADFEISDPVNGSFTVKKDKLENTKYTLTYTTSLSPAEEAQEVKNIANIKYRGGDDKAEANIPKPDLGVRKTAESLDKESNPKVIKWKIIANTDEKNKFVNLQNAVLTDTIPADQKLVSGSVIVKRVGSDETLPATAITEEDNKFTVQLPNGPYQYEIELQTTIESYPSVNEKIDRYTNSVVLTNDNYEPKKADAYIDYFSDGTNNKSAKTGTVNDDTENIDWNLVVNPAGLPINNAKISDSLGSNSKSTYVDDTIKITNSKGEVLNKGDTPKATVVVKPGNKSFDVTFNTEGGQINEPITITYSTKLDSDVIGFVTVSNTVTLTGGKDGKVIDTTTEETKTSQWTYGGGGSGKTLTLNLNKKSNNGNNIPNTEFKIVRVANSGTEQVIKDSIKTDGNGLIKVLSQRAGRYIITELSVPEGYEKATAPLYVIVGYDKDNAPVITPSNSNWDIKEGQKTDTITITNNVIKGNIEATKVWENGPQNKPTVWFQLYRNIEGKTPEPVDGAAIKQLDNGTTKVNWDGLELYKELGNGKTAKYIYSVKEVDQDGKSYVPVNYEKTEDGLTVTNSYVIPKTDITGTKVWENGSKPSVELQLFRDGKALDGDKYTVSIDGSEATPWTHTWTGLDKTDINGKAYKYTVDEVKVPDNYEKVVSEDGLTVTNKFVSPKTDIPVEKVWNDGNNQDGNRPDSIEVELLANGEKVDIDNIILNAENQWKASFSDLPTLDSQGKDITYTVNEVGVPSSYKSEVSGDSIKGFTITNSYTPGKTNVKVNKVWDDSNNQDGIRPNSIEVQLYADGKEKGKAVELNADNNWTTTFANLDEKVAGKVIEYTVKEASEVSGYTTSIDDSDKSNVTITNAHTTETTEVAGTKTWNDADNQDGIRPESITVNLLANGKVVKTTRVSAETEWSYRFTDLPKNEGGKAIDYKVSEEAVEGYDGSVDGFNITNTHRPETTEVVGTKTWDDNDNQDGVRPDSITVNLLANGKVVDTAKVSADTDWKYTFSNLPKYAVGAEGKEVTYTVSENAVEDYTTTYDGFNIINTHTPGKTGLTATKAWNDSNDKDGLRADFIEVQLYADGKAVGKPVKLSADNKWTTTWTDLDEKVAGKTIKYTVKEVTEVKGYTATVTVKDDSNVIITNTHTPKPDQASKPSKPSKSSTNGSTGKGKLPQTGEANPIAFSLLGGVLVIAAGGVWYRKRKDAQK